MVNIYIYIYIAIHYSKGCGGYNPWEGIGCCILYMQKLHLANSTSTENFAEILFVYAWFCQYIICIHEMAGEAIYSPYIVAYTGESEAIWLWSGRYLWK